MTLGRCVLVARAAGRGEGGGGYCSARVLSARFDLPALCVGGARSRDVHYVPISNLERRSIAQRYYELF